MAKKKDTGQCFPDSCQLNVEKLFIAFQGISFTYLAKVVASDILDSTEAKFP